MPQRFYVSNLAFLSHLQDMSSFVILDDLEWDLVHFS